MFLDLDGTLIDIAATPDAVTVPPGLLATLRDVQGLLGGALAILSGRTLSDIDRLLSPLQLTAAGGHGCEQRNASDAMVQRTPPTMSAHMLAALRAGVTGIDGVSVEDKGFAVAIHYRGAPAAAPAIMDVIEGLQPAAAGLQVIAGRKVFELLPAHHSKHEAMTALLQHAPFRGRRPIMIGDDTTDDAAIDAARACGGLGLRVAGEHFAAASADFANPACVRAWLRDFADTMAAHSAAPPVMDRPQTFKRAEPSQSGIGVSEAESPKRASATAVADEDNAVTQAGRPSRGVRAQAWPRTTG